MREIKSRINYDADVNKLCTLCIDLHVSVLIQNKTVLVDKFAKCPSRLNDSRLFLLSSVPTKYDQQLNSAKLATYNEVLRSYISFREDCVRNSKDVTLIKREVANQTVHELKEQYERANIPIVAPHIMCERIIKFNAEFQSLRKLPIDIRRQK